MSGSRGSPCGLGRTEGGQLFVLQVWRRQSCTLLIVGENSGNACYVCNGCQQRWSCHVFTVVVKNGGHVMFFTVVANNSGHVIFLLSLPIAVVMSCFTVVAKNGGHVMFLLPLPITVVMLRFNCRCQ